MTETTDAIIIETKSFDLDKVFAEIGPGYKAIIKRIAPSWCDGILDTIELDPHEPISMDWIAKEYGGRKLQIIVQKPDGAFLTSRTIKFPHAPRYEGRVINREDTSTTPQQGVAQGGSVLGEMRGIFELMINAQKEQTNTLIAAMSSRLEALERGTPGAPAPQDNRRPLSHVKESLATIREIENLKTEMGLGQPAQEEPQESSITRAVDKFTDLIMEKEKAKIKADIAQVNQTQGSPALPAASTYTPPQQAQQAQQTAPQQRPAHTQQIIDGLTDLELAAHVKTRLEGMEEEDRNRLMMQFADQFDFEEDEEDQENPDDTDHTGEKSHQGVNFGQVTVIEDDDQDPLGGNLEPSSDNPTTEDHKIQSEHSG